MGKSAYPDKRGPGPDYRTFTFDLSQRRGTITLELSQKHRTLAPEQSQRHRILELLSGDAIELCFN